MIQNKYVCALGLALLLILSVGFATEVGAKTKRTAKVFAFGFAASFNDSIVHFTEIQPLDSVEVSGKSRFVNNRENYSSQLKNYLEAQGFKHRTCVFSSAFTKKDIEKKYQKMREKYQKAGIFDIRDLKTSDFRFEVIKE